MTAMSSNDRVNRHGVNEFNVRDRLFYLLAGCGIGAVVGLMLAPKSGADLRNDITDLSKKGLDQAKELTTNIKERSTEAYQTIKEKADTVYDLAASKMARAQDVIEQSAENVKDLVNGEIAEASGGRSSKSSASGRKSTNIF